MIFGRQAVEQKNIIPDIYFGPIRIFDSVLWLALASSVRIFGKAIGGVGNLIAMPLSQILVYIAFIAMAHSVFIEAGNRSRIGQFSQAATFHIARKSIKIVLAYCVIITLTAVIAMIAIPLHKEIIILLFGNGIVSFSGIAFPDGTPMARIGGSVICIALFLFTAMLATRQSTKWRFLARQFAYHWQYLFCAVVIVTAANHFIVTNQLKFANTITNSDFFPSGVMPAGFYIVFQTAYGTFRLWLTLTIFTWALKLSKETSS